MIEANVGESATGTGGTATTSLDPTVLEADLETRITRLEQLVAALGVVLDRFQGGAAFGPTVFESFDDPGAGNEALDLLFESATDAHRDLTVLRHDAPTLVGAADLPSEHSLMTRLEHLGQSSTELAGRFEQYRRSIGLTVPPRTPGGVGRLDQFVALVVRALVEIAEGVHVLSPEEGRLGLAASAVAHGFERPTVAEERPRRRTAVLGGHVVAALWRSIRRRRTRLIVESAGVAMVGIVILVSAINQGDRSPGSLADGGSSSGRPGQSGGVAVGDSPSGPPSPASSTGPGASGPPPTPAPSNAVPPAPAPPSAPGPTRPPGPTPGDTAAATRFDNRITAAAESIDGLLSTITTGVQGDSLATVKAAASNIASIATAGRSWLRSHPPRACYRSFYDTALARYGELIATANAVIADADAGDANAIHKDVASAHGDVSALRQAGNKAVMACT